MVGVVEVVLEQAAQTLLETLKVETVELESSLALLERLLKELEVEGLAETQ
jgi:hypothetical protein